MTMTIPKELECPICFKLLYKPVTTACGHNFCKACIEQVNTHGGSCPMCRAPLSMEYGTNMLLMNIIKERYEEATLTREVEEVENAQTEEAAYRAACNVAHNGLLPLIYHQRCDRPLFRNERYSFVINSPDMSRMIKFALTREGRLIRICGSGHGNGTIGAIIRIKNNVAHQVTEDSHIPYVVNTTITDRVELVDEPVSTPYPWFTSKYRIIRDNFVLPESHEQNEAAAVEALHQAISNKAFSGEPLLPEYLSVVELCTKDITEMDRYKLCIALMKICNIIAKRQLNNSSHDARQLFVSRFHALPPNLEAPTSRDIEHSSMFHARLITAKDSQKWSWYTTRDPFNRLLEIARVYAYSGDACILKLEDTSYLDVGPFWFSALILLFFFIIPLLIRKGKGELKFLMFGN